MIRLVVVSTEDATDLVLNHLECFFLFIRKMRPVHAGDHLILESLHDAAILSEISVGFSSLSQCFLDAHFFAGPLSVRVKVQLEIELLFGAATPLPKISSALCFVLLST